MTFPYAAGFIDGEGCIRIAHMKPRGYTPTVQVSNTSLNILEELQEVYGGSISVQKHSILRNHAPSWHWGVQGQEALALLKGIEPHLRIKKTQAQLVLDLPRFQDASRRHKRWTTTELAHVHALMDDICELNRKGV